MSTKRVAVAAAAAAAVAPLLTEAAILAWRIRRGLALAAEAIAFERACDDAQCRVLVAGDSTAVGTGATRPEDSVAGRLGAAHPDWNITNVGRNGSRTRDPRGHPAAATG